MQVETEQLKGPASARRALRDLGKEELEEILEGHRRWVESHGEEGTRADLSSCNLEGIDLTGANLQEALLRKANLRWADLFLADLRGACVVQANLQNTNLLGTNLQEAGLQGANLEGATGLLMGQLAGANLFEAAVPDPIGKFEGLKFVAHASARATKILAAILFVSFCAWLIIGTTRDVHLLKNSDFLPFARVGNSIPMVGFYLIAPVLLLGLYIFFHFYLQRLWRLFAELPVVFPDGRPLDKTGPWLMMVLARKHFKGTGENRPPPSFLERGIAMLLAYWVVPVTLVLFWARYLTRQDLRGTMLHVFLVVAAVAFAAFLPERASTSIRHDRAQPRDAGKVRGYLKAHGRRAITLGTGVLLSLLSVGTIYGAPHVSEPAAGFRSWASSVLWVVGYSPYADLSESDVSTKPASWTGRDEELPLVKGARLNRLSLRHAEAYRAFLVNAHLWETDLQSANLSEADLREANLRRANLQAAVMDRARLIRANLHKAYLHRANLARADLREADLSYASLAAAVLVDARFESANLYAVDLHGASLIRAHLEKADLRDANLEDAKLAHASLREALLSSGKLRGAGLQDAQLQEALLDEADLRGADLRGADLRGAVLRGADLRGANLEGANLRGARGLSAAQICSADERRGVELDETLQHQVDLQCSTAAESQ